MFWVKWNRPGIYGNNMTTQQVKVRELTHLEVGHHSLSCQWLIYSCCSLIITLLSFHFSIFTGLSISWNCFWIGFRYALSIVCKSSTLLILINIFYFRVISVSAQIKRCHPNIRLQWVFYLDLSSICVLKPSKNCCLKFILIAIFWKAALYENHEWNFLKLL